MKRTASPFQPLSADAHSGGVSIPLHVRLETVAFVLILATIIAIPLSESVKNTFFALAVSCWVLALLYDPWRELKIYRVGVYHLLVVAAALVSAVYAVSPFQGIRGVWDIMRSFLFFILVLNVGSSRGRLKGMVGAFAAAMVLGAGWGWYNIVANKAYVLKIHSLGHENHTATYINLMLSLTTAVWMITPSLVAAMAFGGLTLLLIVTLLLTFSRAALITYVVILGLYALVTRSRRAIPLAFFMALVLSVGWVTQSRIADEIIKPFGHLYTRQENTITSRLAQWKKVGQMVHDHPVIGVGPRNFSYAAPAYQSKYNHAHSMYLNVLAEMGVLGLGALLLWLGGYLAVVLRERKALDGTMSYALWLAVVGGLLSMMLSGVFTTTFHTEGAMAFSALMAMFLASLNREDPIGQTVVQFYERVTRPGSSKALGAVGGRRSPPASTMSPMRSPH